MTTYELYINDILCDLSSDEVITLLYQSPIFSSLDSIQSNRSYNIALPPTPANMRAIGQAARPDVDADAPYVRLPAALYQDGVPLFTQGFAVVTDIADTINVTLTWGNADNFQPLFDANLRDLGPQLETAGEDYIEWNEDSAILKKGSAPSGGVVSYPSVAFWGIDFGMGLSNPKYLHPAIDVWRILYSIQQAHGIAIEDSQRLYGTSELPPIVPLVSKNGDEVSNKTEALRFTANLTNFRDKIYGVLGRGSIIQDPQNIAYGSCTTKFDRADYKVHITINPNDGAGSYSYFADTLTGWEIPEAMNLMLTEVDANGGIVKSTALSTSYNVEYLGITDSGLRKYRFDFLALNTIYTLTETTEILLHYEVQTGVVFSYSNPYSKTLTVNIWANWEDCAFPTKFPIAPNLPDISQGDFILAMMSMQGLFAYADKGSPNTIKLISIDDIIANVQKNDIIDWSDRVILNDIHRVDMPDASVFTIDDLAQSNILDYDNDDDVKTDTHGTITIQNENIEKETELVELPFSASENATTDGVNCAVVPLYEDQSTEDKENIIYSECSPRILAWKDDQTYNSSAICTGRFDPWMKFGGDGGIVKTRYASYQKVVDRLRIITIRAKLTALDLYNLDYTKPVYIAQFGQIFAIYSVETGEDGICECQLLKLKVDETAPVSYYLTADEDEVALTSGAQTYSIACDTNGTIKVAATSGDLTAAVSGSMVEITVTENKTGSMRTGTVSLVLKEDSTVTASITVYQESAAASAYYLRLDGLDEDQSVTVGASSSALYEWTVTSDGTPYLVSSDSRLLVDLYEEDGDMYLSVAAPENTSLAPIEYDPVILGIREDSSLRRKATVSQQGANAYLSINGNRSDFAVETSADGEVLELTYATNGTPQVQTFEGDAIDSVDIQEGIIQIATLPNASTAEREGLVVIELVEDPSISITVTVKQAASEPLYSEGDIVIDVSECGVKQDQEITLGCEIPFTGDSCDLMLDVAADLTVVATISDLEGAMGTAFVGDDYDSTYLIITHPASGKTGRITLGSSSIYKVKLT